MFLWGMEQAVPGSLLLEKLEVHYSQSGLRLMVLKFMPPSG